MKTVALVLIGILFCQLVMAQSEKKILVKSFNLQGQETVDVDLEGDIEIKTWNQPTIRIQMSVALENSSTSMLKSLLQMGRYSLKSKTKENQFILFAPHLEKEVKQGDRKLKEKISYTIFVPEYINIETSSKRALAIN